MATRDEILTELRRRRDAHLEAAELVPLAQVRQQIIAHETCARLQAERDEHLKAGRTDAASGVLEQLQYWRRMLAEVPDGQAVDGEPVDEAKPSRKQSGKG